ncbi:type II secretion system inner membrane protein GspF [Thalassolituus alkanivorans]|uniref:type II secretion system inner membrane protein GspF n=1 Tax=Thalassolituus alkanivorans TaxID=2881055 RepID=UPI001E318076|nr:type II secretion system inner membrane protein GspF [Thalassolituus alkanivorans]MCB2387839.1 type II secretion system inner membrane protein GspF [Thalassolituus alkanivorans]MCB2422365.1 type II secretion system inner membrane protein GspF [Thalassolituus alkanivorans]
MAAFEYQAIDGRGKQQKGVLEADSARQVRQQLRDKGWTPLAVEQTAQKQKKDSLFERQPSLSVPELALITRQLATLIQAGLPIDESLRALSEQTGKQRIKAMILAIRAKVLEGYTLAKALAEYPKAFPHLYRSTVSAGEHAGHLDGVLNRLADYTEARQAADQKIKLAAMYPVILTIVAIGIVVGLLTYVVPDIVDVFVKNGQELPGLTQFMLDLSHFITAWGMYTLIAIIVGMIAFGRALKSPAFRKRYHHFLLRVPGLRGFVKDANTARFGSTLAILTTSGVPLVDAMRIASQVVTNMPIQQSLTQATVTVSEGGSLHKALAETGYFPPIMLHMIASGENSGELDSMLARTAQQQETSLENTVSALVKIFEPVMLLVMGGIVATIVAAIMLPILELQKMVQ